MSTPRLSLDRVVVGHGTPRGWMGGMGAAAQVQRVLRAQESSDDDDDEVFVKHVRSARGSRGVQARNAASVRATPYGGLAGSSGGDAANYSAPGASAAEIQRRRKIMFDSDDDDDDTPIYMRGSNGVRTSPVGAKGRKSQAARTKLNKLAKLWGRDDDDSRRSLSPPRNRGSKSPSGSSSDHDYLKPALHHEPQEGTYEEGNRKDHVRFSVEGTRVESPVMFVPTHDEDALLPKDDERTVGFADEQAMPPAVPSPRSGRSSNSYPPADQSGSESDDFEAISGRQQRNKSSALKQAAPFVPAPEPIIHNAQPPIGPPSELPLSVQRLASDRGIHAHKTRLASWHGPDADTTPLLRTSSGQELHPRKLSIPQLEALGVQSSTLPLADSDPQEMAKEIRSLRYEIVQLQRIHRAQVQHLEESAAKTESDMAEMRQLLAEMASLLGERGLVPDSFVVQAENLGRGDEDNASSTKVAISAEFVLDDGLRSQTLSTGGGSDRGSDRLASEMKLASKAGHHVHMADEIQVNGAGEGTVMHQPVSSEDSAKPLVSILSTGKSPRGSPQMRAKAASPHTKELEQSGIAAPLPVVELTPRAVEASSSDKPAPAEKAAAEKKHSLMDTYLDQQSRTVNQESLSKDKVTSPSLGHAPVPLSDRAPMLSASGAGKKPLERRGSGSPALGHQPVDRSWKPIESPRGGEDQGAAGQHESGAFSTPAPTRKNSLPKKADGGALPPVPPAAAEQPPQPALATPVAKTPQQRVKVMKHVTVQRVPIPGTQQTTGAKIGIGISFGVTAKGEVFITGMAPNGPARASGQIRRGDQLISVDGVDVKGWDVNDIVKLIVGDVGSSVTLDVFGLAIEDTMASPATNTPGGADTRQY